jgi:hypothetical protein
MIYICAWGSADDRSDAWLWSTVPSACRCAAGRAPKTCSPGCAATFHGFITSCSTALDRLFPPGDPRRKIIFAFDRLCKAPDAQFFLKAISAATCPKGVVIGRGPPPPPLPPGMCEISINSNLNGPVTLNKDKSSAGIPGWNAHHTKLSIVTWAGRKNVLKNADGGSFSDMCDRFLTCSVSRSLHPAGCRLMTHMYDVVMCTLGISTSGQLQERRTQSDTTYGLRLSKILQGKSIARPPTAMA